MTESGNAAEYLVRLLRDDATLMGLVANRVYLDAPHPDAKTPFVLVTFYNGSDTTEVAGARILSQLDYTARVVAKAKDGNAETIARRIDALLHKAGPNVGLKILGCVRRSPVSMTENDGGVVYKHTGGVYRVFAQ